MTSALPPWDEMAVVGRVGRAHGIKGDVIVHPETDFAESRFEPGAVVFGRRGGVVEPLTVERLRFHRGRPIIGFAGVTTMTAAETMTGVELRVPLAALQRLPAGTFYVHDLVGCRVETRAGEPIGQVVRVSGDGRATHLVVATPAGEALIPLAAHICTEVDVGRQLIVIDPPQGLLEANRPVPGARTRGRAAGESR
jgi:16S rRNA processing protein RimM